MRGADLRAVPAAAEHVRHSGRRQRHLVVTQQANGVARWVTIELGGLFYHGMGMGGCVLLHLHPLTAEINQRGFYVSGFVPMKKGGGEHNCFSFRQGGML